MRLLIYLAIAVVAAYLGYKIAEITISNKAINNNVKPIVEELQMQLSAIQNKLSDPGISENEKIDLQSQRNKVLELLAKFYGYSKEQINMIINKVS